jgi:membrane protein DedA with SNARE-associated domain
MEHLTQFFFRLVEQAGYPGLFLVMVLGNIGIPVGTELIVPAAGAAAGTGHLPSIGPFHALWAVAGIATAGEIAGAGILYAIGYYGGRPFVARWGKFIALNPHKLDIAHDFYERHGRKTVFLCRFIPVIRGIASLPAGISRMQKRYFFPYTAAGSGLFCLGLAFVGSTLGKHINAIAPFAHKASLAIIILVAVVVVAIVARSLKKKQSI